jgi:EpsD family peptidyl-prolyl cis-trans isomerase
MHRFKKIALHQTTTSNYQHPIMYANKLRPQVFLLALLVCAAALSGCGKKGDTQASTQVAAKVGSEEISIHQINDMLGRVNLGDKSPEALKKVSRQILEKLIDQQLAIDQATELKLHRSPEVVAQIEAARRDILANAYLQQFTASLPKPSPEEMKKYYADNPALFAQRRVFNLQEIIAKPGPEASALLKSMGDAGKPMDEIAAALRSKGIPFNGGNVTRGAEQLPLEILPRMSTLKDGQNLSYDTAQAATLIHIVSSQAVPVTEEQALPRIEKFLSNQRATSAIAANLKALRDKTQITYMGEFAKPSATAGAEPAAPPSPTTPAAPAATSSSVIEKGVSGLK